MDKQRKMALVIDVAITSEKKGEETQESGEIPRAERGAREDAEGEATVVFGFRSSVLMAPLLLDLSLCAFG